LGRWFGEPVKQPLEVAGQLVVVDREHEVESEGVVATGHVHRASTTADPSPCPLSMAARVQSTRFEVRALRECDRAGIRKSGRNAVEDAQRDEMTRERASW